MSSKRVFVFCCRFTLKSLNHFSSNSSQTEWCQCECIFQIFCKIIKQAPWSSKKAIINYPLFKNIHISSAEGQFLRKLTKLILCTRLIVTTMTMIKGVISKWKSGMNNYRNTFRPGLSAFFGQNNRFLEQFLSRVLLPRFPQEMENKWWLEWGN